MRRVVFLGFILLGVVAGSIWGLNESWSTTLVLVGVCVLFAGAIGGALASIGRPHKPHSPMEAADRSQCSAKDMAVNHWRDEGHAPFCNPKNFQKESTHVPHVPHKW